MKKIAHIIVLTGLASVLAAHAQTNSPTETRRLDSTNAPTVTITTSNAPTVVVTTTNAATVAVTATNDATTTVQVTPSPDTNTPASRAGWWVVY